MEEKHSGRETKGVWRGEFVNKARSLSVGGAAIRLGAPKVPLEGRAAWQVAHTSVPLRSGALPFLRHARLPAWG